MLERLKNLFRSLSIYGLGDVATSLVNLLLLPIYTRYLTKEDYGVIAMLLTIEAIAKVVFRWGVDTAFMRLYFDCPDQQARQRLASSIFFFLLVVNGALVAVALFSAGWLSRQLFGTPQQALLVALVIANTFAAGFYFLPYQVLRIADKSTEFITLTFARSAGTLVARLVLVIWAGWGVMGVVCADVIVTVLFTIGLIHWFAPLIRPVFSWSVIREALGFGLPRIPHSLAHQVLNLSDRYFLNRFRTLSDVGLYSIGATFGLSLKLFLSALEFAWTPFYLGVMHEPDAKRIYRIVSTYVMATLVLLGLGLCATAPDLVRLFTTEEFHEAAAVTPWIALAVMFQGINLVGSIGLVITKRTTLYPLTTGIAAVVSVAANALLVQPYGVMGVAWATALAYATLAAVTVAFSQRAYPIQYEWNRLLRIVIAGGAGYVAARWVVPVSVNALAGLLLHGATAAAVYFAVLLMTGFFHAGEIRMLREIRARILPRVPRATPEPDRTEVEMAGEIIAVAPEPDVAALELDDRTKPRPPVHPEVRPPRR
ncbi:MAG TPA: oligosaccharide flippase family protein [Vicinamibacterales bacterium]|nr:oligosaccharide flippase family protein [Vicinamibacterales bacterium]